ncbi:MAG: hypothetical protein ACI8X5_001563 [Planctomycetota bacterium]|jgi:hypothetical protein
MKQTFKIATIIAALALPVLAIAGQGRGAALKDAEKEDEKAPTPELDLQAEAKANEEEVQKELARAYFAIADYDSSAWISYREARDSLEIDRARFHVYDADLDGQITVEEYIFVSLETFKIYSAFKAPIPNPDDPTALSRLQALSDQMEADALAAEEDSYLPAEASSVQELFGRVIQRVQHEHSAPRPNQIVGPVYSFRRLDQKNTGYVTRKDMEDMLLGAGIDIRPNSILAALDMNGDNAISKEEFRVAMGDHPLEFDPYSK